MGEVKELGQNLAFKNWSLEEWNKRLVSGILRQVGPSGTYEPLTRLTITPDILATTVSPGSPPETLYRSFQACITKNVLSTGHAFDTAAEHLQIAKGWTPASHSDPPFWAYLVFTCYVAGTPEISAHNYRERLCSTLPGTTHQSLVRLPQLWKDVATWTRNQSKRFGNCRILILPDPRSRTIIGYSYYLAFPSRRDNEILVAALEAADLLGAEPPVASAMVAIEDELGRFSSDFRTAYEHFRKEWYAHRLGGGRDRFWAAVRDAAMRGRTSESAVQWSMILGEELEGEPQLWVVTTETYRSREWLTTITNISGEDVNLVCWESRGSDQAQEAVEQILGGATLPRDASMLSHAVSEGILLFEVSGPGIYRFSPRLTDSQNFYLAIKGSALQDSISRAIGLPARRCRYPGWRMLGPVTRDRVLSAATRNKFVARARCLQETAPPPRIYVSGGFFADSGTSTYLGLARLLPHLRITGADDVRLEKENGTTICLQKLNSLTSEWSFPREGDVEGEWSAIARCNGEEFATLTLRFSREYHGHEYKEVTNPAAWLAEAPTGQLLPYDKIIGETPSRESELIDADKWDVECRAPTALKQDEGDKEQVDQLSLALASMFSHRKGLPESELLPLFRRILDINEYEFWHVYRSWQEAGRLRRLHARRWRSFLAVPVRPHFVVYRSGGLLQATMSGLWYPELTHKLQNVCKDLRLQMLQLHAGSRWSPVSFRISTPDFTAVDEVTRQCGIAPVRPLLPIALIQGANLLFAAERPDAPSARNPEVRRWDFAKEIGIRLSVDVAIEQIIVQNQPDVFMVRESGEIVYWTRSRIEVWLVASWVAGYSAFKAEGTRSITMSTRQAYLPLVVGQYGSVFDVASPSPPVGTGWQYRYELGSGRLRDLISSKLLPIPKPKRTEIARMVVQLVLCTASSQMVPVSAIPGWRRLISLADARQLGMRTHVPARIIPLVAAAIRQL